LASRELPAAVALLKGRMGRGLEAQLSEGDFCANLLAYLRGRETPRLLFDGARLGETARAAMAAGPDEAAWEREIADNAVEGRLYAASNPHCRRFLAADPDKFDFSSCDIEDPEAIHGLCRMRWLACLGKAYWETGEGKYFEALLRQWDFFEFKAPTPGEEFWRRVHAAGPVNMAPPFGELDTFIRLTNWYWAFWLGLFAREMTAERCAGLLARCLRLFDLVAARGVKRHEHNFTSMQMEALYLWASALPEFTGMTVWRHAARNILESSLERAVFDDGAQWEKSAGYHGGCIRWYATPCLLGMRNGDEWAAPYLAKLRKMGEYLDAILTPDGKYPLMSDSDRQAGTEPLSLLRLLFADMKFRRSVGPSYYTAWVGDGETWKAEETVGVFDPVAVFPQAGVAAVHPGGAGGASVLLDNGPTSAGHAHLNNLTIHYDLPQGPVIVDPGRWIYRSDADRAWVIRCFSHNTVFIEDAAIRPEDWIQEPGFARIFGPEDNRVSPIRVGEEHGATVLETAFRGFAPDARAEARRLVVMPNDPAEVWLGVVDRMEAPRPHSWTNAWLFPSAKAGRETETGYEMDLSWGARLRMAFVGDTLLALRDEAKFWCPNYGEKEPARWVRLTSHCQKTRRAFLFAPVLGGQDVEPQVDLEADGVVFTVGRRKVRVAC